MGRFHQCPHRPVAALRRTWKRWVGFLILGAAVVWVAYSTVQEQGASLAGQEVPGSKRVAGAGVGSPAPTFRLTDVDEQTLALDAYQGQVVMLSFFATWCDSCKEELPLVKDLADQGAEKGFSVVGIAMRDRKADLAHFVRQEAIPFPAAVDVDGHVARAFRVIAPPATIFIDAEGVIRHVVMGPLTLETALDGLQRARVELEAASGGAATGGERG